MHLGRAVRVTHYIFGGNYEKPTKYTLVGFMRIRGDAF